MPDQSRISANLADFGPNEWLADEMYQLYLTDPASVDPAWKSYFDAHPGDGNGGAGNGVTGKASAATNGSNGAPAPATSTGSPRPKRAVPTPAQPVAPPNA
ncbi:MAG: hypothetical protein M3Y71_10390, partial [Actinomycetota bacterium]|nr:hypothetical protein [Actinomycetota bacterium]